MNQREEHRARVALGCEYLDAQYGEFAWRSEAVAYANAGSPSRELLRCVSSLVRRPNLTLEGVDDGGRHAFDLAHGFTIDYSHLGYPSTHAETPRHWRERAAWAELEATWWEALAP